MENKIKNRKNRNKQQGNFHVTGNKVHGNFDVPCNETHGKVYGNFHVPRNNVNVIHEKHGG